jgi:hypothetical protein
LLQLRKGWRSTVDGRPWLETMYCTSLEQDESLCIFFIFQGSLGKSVGTAMVVVSRALCTCLYELELS